jgi:uncharacterized protein YjgD (DUF1641 family)
MAAPIKFESSRSRHSEAAAESRDAREELLERLELAPAEHAEALLSVYDLLQGLHERGVLDAVNGALSSSNFILETIVETANTAENIRAARNLLLLGQVLGRIDPDMLGQLAAVLPEALEPASQARTKAPSLFSLLKKFNSRDSRRGLAFAAGLLESLGKRLGESRVE